MAKARGLSKADLQLWAAFSQNIMLLPGKTRLPTETEPAKTPPPAAPLQPPSRRTRETGSLTAGKIRTLRTLDLHGHTAARAHHAVRHFIERAYAEQIRCVEIITGNGEILHRELPYWLNAPALRPLILAITHPHAANTGAVRILLKRIR
jgi:DNA-nicking Smr family endonuclease